jgi:hypothetical protein
MERDHAGIRVAILLLLAPLALAAGDGAPEGTPPGAALGQLKEGNRRYTTSAVNPRRYRAERPRR